MDNPFQDERNTNIINVFTYVSKIAIKHNSHLYYNVNIENYQQHLSEKMLVAYVLLNSWQSFLIEIHS